MEGKCNQYSQESGIVELEVKNHMADIETLDDGN